MKFEATREEKSFSFHRFAYSVGDLVFIRAEQVGGLVPACLLNPLFS